MFQQVLSEETWVVDENSPVDLKVLSSATDIIAYCIDARKNMATLNQNQAFFDLFKLFKDYLLRFGTALNDKLTTLRLMCWILRWIWTYLLNFSFNAANLTPPEEMTCCLIINTCEYVSGESRNIKKVFQEEINDKFKDQIDTQAVVDSCQAYEASYECNSTKKKKP